jgi:hypothetical protein
MDAIPDAAMPGGAVPAPAAAAKGSYPVVEPHPAPDGKGWTNLSDEDYHKFNAGIEPPAATGKGMGWMDAIPDAVMPAQPPKSQSGKMTGALANMGAGMTETAADTLGAPVDLATGAMNLIPRGINAVAGTKLPTIDKPVLGSDWWKGAAGVIGADPRKVEPDGGGERVMRGAGRGVGSMVLPYAAARSLPVLAGLPGAAQQMLGAGSAPAQAGIGAMAGGAGGLAQEAVPDPWKPVADFGGQMVGGGLTAGTGAAVKGVGGAGKRIVTNFAKPFTAGGREQLAGQRIERAASDPAAVRESLERPAPPLVPGSEPTTYQLTGDQGLGNLERAVAKDNPDQFLSRVADQNRARVGAIEGVQPEGSPEAVGRSFIEQLDAIHEAGRQTAAGAQTRAQQATEALGNAPPVGADAQASVLQRWGGRIRGGLDTLNTQRKAAVSRLYAAVDPDGTLAVDLRPFKEQVAEIAKGWPKNAKPLQGEAGAVFGVSRMQPAVQKFSEVAALRQRIGDAMAEARGKPELAQEYRQLTLLRGALDDTLSGAVAGRAAEETGTAMADRLRGANGEASRTPAGDGLANRPVDGGVQPGHGQPGEISPGAGEQVSSGRGQGDAGRSGPVSAGAADEVGRKPQDLVDFLIREGGVRDSSGELRNADLDKVHIRQGGRLLNEGRRGLTMDQARERAIEGGFLPPNATNNDLIDALTSKQPVYPISESAEAYVRGRQAAEGRATENARYDARDRIGTYLDEAGERLSRAEIEHATDLHLHGASVEDAVRQAATATEETVLQRNAQASAFGRPGVPPGAAQADLGVPETGLTPNFDEAALARRRAADAAHAERMQTYGQKVPGVGPVLAPGGRPGAFRMGASEVPANLFTPGKGGAERIQAAQRAAAGNPQIMKDLEDYAAFSFRRAAEGADGTIDPAKAAKWRDAHSEVMGAFPDLAKRFDTATRARQALDEAAARQTQRVADFQTAAVSRLMGDADPVQTVGRILNSDTALAQMQDLARKTAGDPVAREGLRRAVVRHILDNLRTNQLAGDTRTMNNNPFQTFVRKTPAALRTVFSADEVAAVKAVADDLQRAQKSITDTKLPGGSNTAQDMAAGAKHTSHGPSLLNTVVAMEVGGELASHIATGGWAKVAGMIGTTLGNAMRAAGLSTVDDLVTQAMLNPALAKMLLSKVPPSEAAGRSAGRLLADQIRGLAAVSAVNSSTRRDSK